MYGSSWFYDKANKSSPATTFPTIQEQVQMCRQIASQLVDEQNARSKGASMFFKRVRRAPAWEVRAALQVDVAAAPTPDAADERVLRERLKQTMLSPGGTPLHRVMDPRGRTLSLETVSSQGHVTHDAVPAAVCSRLVQDMQSPDASPRAAALFLARKLKAAEWEAQADQRRERIVVGHKSAPAADTQEYPALYATAYSRQPKVNTNRYSCNFESEQRMQQKVVAPMGQKFAPAPFVPPASSNSISAAPAAPVPHFSLLAQQQQSASTIRTYNSYNTTPKSWTAFKQHLASAAS